MSQYKATILWERGEQLFLDNRYSRVHKWFFEGKPEINASSSSKIVPVPYSNPNFLDPEETFVASISSCHMLWFLSIAAKKKHCIDIYKDEAYGIMEKNDKGFLYIKTVIIQPNVIFSGDNLPNAEEKILMHEEAHKQCFIANSVKSDIQFKFNN